MDFAMREFENRPNILDDGMIISYIYNRDIPYDKICQLMDFVRKYPQKRRYRGRDHEICVLSVYNAWYTRALQEKDIQLPDPSNIPRYVIKNADPSEMNKFVYLE